MLVSFFHLSHASLRYCSTLMANDFHSLVVCDSHFMRYVVS